MDERDNRGDKSQRDTHHHGKLMNREMQLAQRLEKAFQSVGELKRRGGIGQQECVRQSPS